MHSGRWDTFASRVHYWGGALYYLYHLSAILGVGSFLSVVILPIFLSFSFYPVFQTVFIVLSLGTIFYSIYFWLRANRIQRQSLNPGLKILYCEFSYSVLGNGGYESQRKVIARAVYDGVHRYIHKFWWTGSGKIEARTRPPYSAEIKQESYGINRECIINFNNQLQKNSEVTVDYNMNLTDAGGTTLPFFQSTINTLIKRKLILRVRFNNLTLPPSFIKELLMPGDSNMPIQTEECSFPTGSHEAVWEIHRPRLFYRYRICWEKQPSEVQVAQTG